MEHKEPLVWENARDNHDPGQYLGYQKGVGHWFHVTTTGDLKGEGFTTVFGPIPLSPGRREQLRKIVRAG